MYKIIIFILNKFFNGKNASRLSHFLVLSLSCAQISSKFNFFSFFSDLVEETTLVGAYTGLTSSLAEPWTDFVEIFTD